MSRYEIDAKAHSAAAPAAVFALLADGSTWVRWGAWTRFDLESPGEGAPEGPGAIRVFTSRAFGRTVVSRERVLEVVPGESVSYALLSGLPLRNYRGRVQLTPDDDGTAIHWHSEFDGAVWGSGRLYQLALGRFIADAAQRVARYAELPAAA